MKVIGIDGKTYRWNLTGHIPLLSDERPRSKLHKDVKQLLTLLFPVEQIFEEVYLPGSLGLTADFVIPTQKLIIEAHGEQHYHFVGFFYKNIYEFIEAKQRDKNKIQWAELNRFTLIGLPYNEDNDQWTKRIKQKIS